MSRSETSRDVSVSCSRAVDAVRPLARAVDERAAVRRDEVIDGDGAHDATAAGTSPSSSSFATTSCADSSGECASVSITSSGLVGRLVRVVDAREALDLAGERLLVEALHVALRALLHRGCDVHLHERAPLLDHLASLLPRLLVRRDGRGDDRAALPRQPRGDPADALDVRVAVLLREAEALGEARADGVAVEVLDDEAAPVELGPDEMRDRRLPGAREPGEPQREATVALVLRLGVLVGIDVLGHASFPIWSSR